MNKQICFSLLFIGLLFGFVFPSYAARQPDWIKKRPVDSQYYIGIGRALKTSATYMQEAKQQALSDLVSEIEIKVSVNSLMQNMEANEQIGSFFEETIRTSAQNEIQAFEVVDSWQDSKEYWVYYHLNKSDYEAFVRKQKEAILKKGFDFWYRGQEASEAGDLLTAIDFYMSGIEAISPCLNEDLICNYENSTIHLGTELYTAIKNIFNGLTITPSEETLRGEPFREVKDPVIIAVTKEGVPLRNLKLSARFISGSGSLFCNGTTDENGLMPLHIKNITSKNSRQEIQVSLDIAPFNQFKGELFEVLKKQIRTNQPACTVLLDVIASPTTACLLMKQSNHEGLARGIRTLLTNNYFTLIADESQADYMVLVDVKFEKGDIITSDLYNIREYFTTVEITLLDNKTQAVVLTYLLDKKRTGTPEKTSLANAQNAATREVLKQITKEFGKQLNELKK